MNERDCTYFEEQASALLDSEIDQDAVLELMDHVVRCEACAEFYSAARELGGVVAVVRAPRPDGAAPPRELWGRIECEAQRRDAVSRMRIPAWAMRAAAAVVVAVGLGALSWWGSGQPAVRPVEAVVEIGGAPDSMTEVRFVELTKEVLRADPRYHAAMHRVMGQVVRDTHSTETAAEYDLPNAPDEGGRNDTTGRQPA